MHPLIVVTGLALAEGADDSEPRGNKLASKLLDKLLKVHGDSAKSFKAVEQALSKLAKLPNQKDAIAGFSAGIYPVLRIGAANIPKQTGSAITSTEQGRQATIDY